MAGPLYALGQRPLAEDQMSAGEQLVTEFEGVPSSHVALAVVHRVWGRMRPALVFAAAAAGPMSWPVADRPTGDTEHVIFVEAAGPTAWAEPATTCCPLTKISPPSVSVPLGVAS